MTQNQFSIKRIEPTSYVFSKNTLLGKGTFGDVYLGFDEKKKIPIAVKTISLDKIKHSNVAEEHFFQKLSRQMINMQICKSPHLVQLISPHKSPKNMYLVCEYCNGGSLKNYLAKHGVLSERQAIHFFKDILEGIKCLYSKKVVHRDLKPANILMHNFELKIGDLGFSRSLDMHEQSLTSIVGTPLYMSPQILMQRHYTQKTDIWSLGIILYEMLSGEAPWSVNSIQEIKQKIKQKPDINRLVSCSTRAKQLILRMLEYDESRRIGLEQLFEYFPDQQAGLCTQAKPSQMIQETAQIPIICKKLHNHFAFSMSLESEHKMKYILKQNKIQPVERVWDNCQTVRVFLQEMFRAERLLQENEYFVKYYTALHAKLAYLLYMMMVCFEHQQQIECQQIYAVIFLVLKYFLALINEILSDSHDRKIGSKSEKSKGSHKSFKSTSFWGNYRLLLELELSLVQQFYQYYYSVFFVRLTQRQNLSQVIDFMNSNLHGLYEENSDDKNNPQSIKLLQFWLSNFLHMLFNSLRRKQNYAHHVQLLLSRLIFEYSRSSITGMFQNIGSKVNILHRIESWQSAAHYQQWKNRIKQSAEMEVEDIKDFLKREMSANKLAMYQISFLE